MFVVIFCFNGSLSSNELYTFAKSFNISVGVLSCSMPSFITVIEVPASLSVFTILLEVTFCKFVKIDLKEVPISSPLFLVVAVAVPINADNSSIFTPVCAAKAPVTFIALAISVILKAFLFVHPVTFTYDK